MAATQQEEHMAAAQQETSAGRLAVSVSEAARMLSISVSHAWDLVYDGRLPTVRFGKSVRVSVPALLEMLSGSTGSASPAFDRAQGSRKGSSDGDESSS
jgi:excisionase family DNA binding protein